MIGIHPGGACGLNCLTAKEEECKCSCGGANHGVYKRWPKLAIEEGF